MRKNAVRTKVHINLIFIFRSIYQQNSFPRVRMKFQS